MFVLSPSGIGLLPKGEPASIAVTMVTDIVDLAAGVQNWLRREMLLHERIMLVVGGLLLAYSDVPKDAVGIIILGMTEGMHLMRTR